MPGGYPLLGISEANNWLSLGVTPNTDENTKTVLCGGPNAKGSWVELTASAAGITVDASFLAFMVYGANAAGAGSVGDPISVDIGIGPSGSQIVFVPDITIIWQNDGCDVLIPLSVPIGTRVWARGQGVTAGDNICVGARVGASTFQGAEGLAGCDCLGFTSTTTLGTAVTWGSAGSKGSYASIITATARDYYGFCVSANIAYGATAGGQFICDVALGTTIIQGDICFWSAGSYIVNPISQFFPVPIPKGSNIQCRGLHTNSGTATAYQTIYGFY